MSLSYQNSGAERNKQILGEIPLEILPNEWVPRWQAYRPLPPHEIVKRYDLKIVDIFGMENRAMKAQQLTMYGELAAKLVPGFNSRPLLERLGHYNDFKKDEVGEILGKEENALPSPRPQMPGGPVNIGPSLVPRNNDVAPAPEVPQVGA